MVAPVFIKINKYQEVLATVDAMMKKVEEARSELGRVHELKEAENKEVETWKRDLANIESRLVAIKEVLAKPEEV